MQHENVRLSVTIPAHILSDLEAEVGARGKSSFIAKAVEEKLEEIKKARLEAELAEGYRATREEGLALSAEFERSDLEGWKDDY